jgi:glycosyltransferase involved in cell wall biosynthesis
MRAAIVIRDLKRGGAQRQTVALALGLAKLGHDICVFTVAERGALASFLSDGEVRTFHLGRGGVYDVITPMRRLRKMVSEWRPDVLYGFMPLGSLLVIFSRRNGVASVVGIRGSSRKWGDYALASRLSEIIVQRMAGRADRVIANSGAGLDLVKSRRLPGYKGVVIPNGIDVDTYLGNKSRTKEYRGESGQPTIAVVGRFHPMKGHVNLVQALASRRLRAVPWSVRLVGAFGPALPAVEEYLEREALWDRVTLEGEAEDVSSVYSEVDVIVLPSRYGEGFSNVVGEAMASEVPCIVTDVGDSAAIIGSEGWVVPPEDVESLEGALWEALQMSAADRAEVGRRARERIKGNFSTDRMVGLTEAILLDAVGTRQEKGGGSPLGSIIRAGAARSWGLVLSAVRGARSSLGASGRLVS